MLKKLRAKFIAIIVASVAIVLAVVFTGVCVSEYQRSLANVNEALQSAVNRASETRFQNEQDPSADGGRDVRRERRWPCRRMRTTCIP